MSQSLCIPSKDPVDSDDWEPDEEAFTGHGMMVNCGPFDNLESKAAQLKMGEFAKEKGFGEPAVTFRLKDWGIRYGVE